MAGIRSAFRQVSGDSPLDVIVQERATIRWTMEERCSTKSRRRQTAGFASCIRKKRQKMKSVSEYHGSFWQWIRGAVKPKWHAVVYHISRVYEVGMLSDYTNPEIEEILSKITCTCNAMSNVHRLGPKCALTRLRC